MSKDSDPDHNMIWIKPVCKDYQKTTKVAPSIQKSLGQISYNTNLKRILICIGILCNTVETQEIMIK